MSTASDTVVNLDEQMLQLGRQAKEAARSLTRTSEAQRNRALGAAADRIESEAATILVANGRDLASARERGLSAAMLDRLALDEQRLLGVAAGLRDIARLPDPLGRVLAEWTRPNGLNIQRVSVPLGVIGIIYESRPNVTADAGGLCLKSGNAVILRGGSESFHSSLAIYEALVHGLEAADISPAAIQLVPTRDRAAVGHLLGGLDGSVDVIVPRGGKSLIARVQQDARVPVIGHLEGLCHVYVHGSAELEMAKSIVLNAKLRRTGICGAAETLLVDERVADTHLGPIVAALIDAGCEVRGDRATQAVDDRVRPAGSADWATEYLDAIIAVRVVSDLAAAVEHIERFGSGHTESIVTNDADAASEFFAKLDSAILLHNASTQYADGGEFGMGAEIGIATGKIHARGPVGAEQLTSYKYLVRGNGQCRP